MNQHGSIMSTHITTLVFTDINNLTRHHYLPLHRIGHHFRFLPDISLSTQRTSGRTIILCSRRLVRTELVLCSRLLNHGIIEIVFQIAIVFLLLPLFTPPSSPPKLFKLHPSHMLLLHRFCIRPIGGCLFREKDVEKKNRRTILRNIVKT